MNITSSRGLYRFSNEVFTDFPEISQKLGKGTGNMIVSNSFERAAEIMKLEVGNNDYKILGRFKGKRQYRYMDQKYLLDNEYINTYNVLIPKSNGSGALGETLSTPLIGEPLIGATDTFISIGMFHTLLEAENLFKYIKSRFARTLLGVLKITQDNPRSVWKYVPLQDFTANSDIDWTKSIPEIDQQLYKKYGLDEKEIDFIETHVKEMD